MRQLAICMIWMASFACGGSDSGTDIGPEEGTVIGPEGGTVVGPDGAMVVIPPGALTTDTIIGIERTSSGAPLLSVGFSAFGEMFAFTPHGTSFTVPVTLTVPFDAALVSAGVTPGLYKTNAQDRWERVASVTVDADTVSGQVTSFSHVVAGVERLAPQRQWQFILKTEEVIPGDDFSLPAWKKVHTIEPFPANVFTFDDDRKTTLEVFSSTDGVTFWASAEDVGQAQLTQTQGFIKRAEDATLEFVITEALLEATDLNEAPTPGECPRGEVELTTCSPIIASIAFSVQAVDETWTPLLGANGESALAAMGDAILEGRNGQWDFDASPFGYDSVQHAWSDANFAYNEDLTHPKAELVGDIVLPVDLSELEVDDEFFVVSYVEATAVTMRLRESGVRALVRDPARSGGTIINTTGLELTTNSLPPPPPPAPKPPIPCTTGPDPAAGTLQFSAGGYTTLEALFTGRDVIRVTRSQGTTGAVSATFTAGGGTALPGTHYTPLNVTVRFADGDATTRTIPLAILNNGNNELDRTVNLTLSEPGGCATLGAQSSAVLTILDDDRKATEPQLFTVGGTVNGLIGTGFVLQDHHGLFLEITGDGPFIFSDLPSPAGTPYSVSVFNQPRKPTQVCTVTNGTGVFGDANVTNVVVTCV